MGNKDFSLIESTYKQYGDIEQGYEWLAQLILKLNRMHLQGIERKDLLEYARRENESRKYQQLNVEQLIAVVVEATTLTKSNRHELQQHVNRSNGESNAPIPQPIVEEPVDVSQFAEISILDLAKILSTTIVGDDDNKVLGFLGMLSAYSAESQMNTSFNGRSSAGKTHIVTELAKYFPTEDVLLYGKISPTAFFHDEGRFDKVTKTRYIDLERKILVFLDMPHSLLLEQLRPFFSHDKKVIYNKITDANSTGGRRTKTVALMGYPSVLFCSANLSLDEQEATRFILLSPETTQAKLQRTMELIAHQEANGKTFTDEITSNPARQALMLRIKGIKAQKVGLIGLADEKLLLDGYRTLVNGRYRPRSQRDIKRVSAIAKSLALLNCWFRQTVNETLIANEADIQTALNIWSRIMEPQELGISPAVLEFFEFGILPAYQEAVMLGNTGADRVAVMKTYAASTGNPIQEQALRKQILPSLINAGLLTEEVDKNDKRKKVLIVLQPGWSARQGAKSIHDQLHDAWVEENIPDKVVKDDSVEPMILGAELDELLGDKKAAN